MLSSCCPRHCPSAIVLGNFIEFLWKEGARWPTLLVGGSNTLSLYVCGALLIGLEAQRQWPDAPLNRKVSVPSYQPQIVLYIFVNIWILLSLVFYSCQTWQHVRFFDLHLLLSHLDVGPPFRFLSSPNIEEVHLAARPSIKPYEINWRTPGSCRPCSLKQRWISMTTMLCRFTVLVTDMCGDSLNLPLYSAIMHTEFFLPVLLECF